MSLVNRHVILSGLQNRSDLNGKRGYVLSFDNSRQRYNVSVGQNEGSSTSFQNLLSLKEENLIIANSVPTDNSSNRTFLLRVMDVMRKALQKMFTQENLGFSAAVFLLTNMFLANMVSCTMVTTWIVFVFELLDIYKYRMSVCRDILKVKESFQSLEQQVGSTLTMYFGSNSAIDGGIVIAVVTLLFVAYKRYARSLNSYSGDYYFDEGFLPNGLNSVFDFGGISLISIVFLGLIIMKLDIPNNGLGALRNLNFFEIMYLYNILNDIFGGRGRRVNRGYSGYRRSPYGYGGYRGYGRRTFW